MTAVDRTLESLELIKAVKSEEADEVDALKVVEKNGVDCLIDMRDYPEQEEHESSVSYSTGGENGE